MDDKDKTKAQLINELVEIRQRVTELEALDAERGQAEQVLRESEVRYRTLFERAHDAIFLENRNEEILDVNRRACQLTGYSRKELLSMKTSDLEVEEIRCLPPGDIYSTPDPTQGETFTDELLHRNGARIPVEITIAPLTDGESVLFLSIVRDITEHKRVEERLTKVNECFLSFGQDAVENINCLTALCGELLGATCALYNRLDQGLLWSTGQWQAPPDYNPVDKPDGHICYDVIKRGRDEALVVRNLPQTPYAQTDPNVIPYQLQTYVGKAVKCGGVYVGALCAVFQRDFIPSEEDRKLMGIIASAIGVEEGRRRAEEELREHRDHLEELVQERTAELQSEVAEHRWAGEALRESEERYRAIFEQAADSIVLIDAESGALVEFNDKAHENLGYTREEFEKLKIPDFEVVESAGEVAKHIEKVIEEGADTFEAKHRTKGGEERDVLVSTKAISVRGRDLIQGIWRDITERVRAEEALRESEEHFREVLEYSQDVLYKRNLETGQYEYLSPAIAKIIGYAPDEVMAMSPDEIDSKIHPEDIERVNDLRRKVLETPQGHEVVSLAEYRVKCKDGSYRWISDHYALLRGPEGRPLFSVASVRDITERVRAEEALKESELRHRTQFDEALDAILIADAETGIMVDCNRAALELVGRAKSDLVGKHQRIIHPPEEIEGEFSRTFRQHLKEKEGKALEAQVITKSGEIRDVSIKVNVFELKGKKVMQGIFRDVTERKQAEKTLEQRAAQLMLLNDVGGKIAAVLELDSLLERAARLVQESFGYHHVGLFTVDRERDELVMKTRAGDFAPLYPPDHRLKLGQGVVGWAGRRGETLLANDVDAEPCYVNLYPDLVPTRSELSVPIRVGEEIVGVLDVQSPQLNAFDQSDVMVVETLADQIAVAIENARLHEAVRRELTERARAEERLRQRNRELELLNRAGQAFLSTLDLDHVLATVLEEVRQLLNVTACSAWVVDLVTEELVCRQVTNPQSEIVRGWRLPPGQGLVGWATQHGESLNVSDVRADERHFKGVDQKTGLPLRSILTVPLRIKEDVIGVLQAVDTEVGRFNSTDLMLVESLASTAAGAIESARLYEALRASQEYARNIIDSSLDMIVAVDMDRRIVEFNTAAQGALGYRPGEVVGERIDILYADQQQAITVHETTIEKGRCVREVSSRRKNGQVFPSFLSSSVLCDTQGELVGVMGVSRDITERVRAEEALRRRNRELALLNEANQALSASLDQDQVLATFLDEVCRLLGVAAISAWLVDPGTDELVCRQATGPRSEIVHDWRLAPGEGIAGRVAANGESLFVPDTRADPRHFKGVDKQTGLEIRSILSVPLRVKQEVIGALQIVDGTANRFRPTDLVLLESLAATAAIAIEHARLYEQARQDAEARARLLREVNHRVKNNLSAIIGILYAERQYVEIKGQASYQSVMQDLANRVRGLATVHSLLSTSEWAPLRLSDLAAQISRSSLQVLPPGKHISIDVPLSPVRVTPDQAHYLALVINELATNTVKHAAQERDTAQISVHIALDDDVVLLEFRDDGPGYPEDVLRLERHSVGFDLIRSIVRDGLRGELVLRNDHGAVTLIRFKAQTEADEI